MTTASTINQDQVERKVESLQGSEFSATQLRRACRTVLGADLPLRDSIVLREAKRLAEQETPEAQDAWEAVLPVLRRSVPESTYLIWLEPCLAFGAEGDTLILEAPENVRGWTERRYSHLIGEALQQHTDFQKVRFVSAGGES